jgi:polygalacturonase
VENCEMSSPDLERGIRIKTNSLRGGLIENFYIRNVDIGMVKDAIVINFYYEEGDAGRFDPIVRNIVIEDLRCEQAARVFQLHGYPRAPIRDLVLRNVRFDKAGEVGVVENVAGLIAQNFVINGKKYAFTDIGNAL